MLSVAALCAAFTPRAPFSARFLSESVALQYSDVVAQVRGQIQPGADGDNVSEGCSARYSMLNLCFVCFRYAWCRGAKFIDILKMAPSMFEGNIIRCSVQHHVLVVWRSRI